MQLQKEVTHVQPIQSRQKAEEIEASQAQNEIVINGLVKKYGDITAVNNLNLNIRKGEMFGFLGPNGAGKTTAISISTLSISGGIADGFHQTRQNSIRN